MDPELIRTLNKLDADTRKRLLAYEGDIKKALEQHLKNGKIEDKSSLFKKLAIAAGVFGAGYATILLANNRIAAKRAQESDNALLLEVFTRAGANKDKVNKFLNSNQVNTTNKIATGFLNRNFPGTKKSVNQRIKTLQDGSEQVVRNIIMQGVIDGKSSWKIAREIGAYVTPNANGLRVAPWTITRRELGKPVSYIPKNIPAGSVEYNAFRIARAETVETYQNATYLANKDKWYYNGTKWHLSRAHPKADRCDDYATHEEGLGTGVWRKKPALPHPHCICFTTTETISTDEMIEGFKLVGWL